MVTTGNLREPDMQNLTKYLIIALAIISSSCSSLDGGYRHQGSRYVKIWPLPSNSDEPTEKSNSSDPRPHPPNQEKFIAAHRLMNEKNYQGALSLYKEIDAEGLDQVKDPGQNINIDFNHIDPKQKAKQKEYSIYLAQINNLTAARFIIGKIYEKGYLGEKDYNEAANWYLKASEFGSTNPYSFNAAIRLHLFYYYGLGVPQSKSESMAWFQRSLDYVRSLSNTTEVAIHKFAIENDAMPASLDEYDNFDIKATYQKAEDALARGHNEEGAKLMLSCVVRGGNSKDEIIHKAEAKTGYLFLRGDGLPENREYGINLLTRATNGGNGEASFQMAMMYRKGEYVQKDKAKSNELLNKAADLGSADAKKILYADEQELQREQARERARKKKEEAENLKFISSLLNAQKRVNTVISPQEQRSQCLDKCNRVESDCESHNSDAYTAGFLTSGGINFEGAEIGMAFSKNCSSEKSWCLTSCGQ